MPDDLKGIFENVRWRKLLRLMLDAILISAVVACIVLSSSGLVSPGSVSIQCVDSSLHLPFKKSTISIKLLLSVSLIVPFLMMLVIEWANLHSKSFISSLVTAFRRGSGHYFTCQVGSIFTYFIISLLKNSVSEPRPHFMNSCKPNLTEDLCQNIWVDVSYTDCLNPLNLSFPKLINTMKSFPSGHACIGVYVALFMILYCQQKVKMRSVSYVILPIIQLMWVTWALVCCVSRITDNKHHWWDVAVGALIGGSSSYTVVSHYCNWFERAPSRNTVEKSLKKEDPSDSAPLKNGNGLIVAPYTPSGENQETNLSPSTASPVIIV